MGGALYPQREELGADTHASRRRTKHHSEFPTFLIAVVDWFILGCRRNIDLGVDSRHSPNLANIYRVLADQNRSNVPFPSSPPPFSPPTYAVRVNSLWLLSLIIGLSCALVAALLRKWSRRYIRVTQPRFSAHVQARIHAFFAEGSRSFILYGRSRPCIRCYTSPSPYSLLASLCSYGTSISRFSSWCCLVSASAQFCMEAGIWR
ncbi:hypothetical protein EDB85DRAFT_339010 [Lactarius pseudohatsudake]|nr:hypothetical protein EDB85DRAFT_339010 [Lactarius pseudohatsudake]